MVHPLVSLKPIPFIAEAYLACNDSLLYCNPCTSNWNAMQASGRVPHAPNVYRCAWESLVLGHNRFCEMGVRTIRNVAVDRLRLAAEQLPNWSDAVRSSAAYICTMQDRIFSKIDSYATMSGAS